MFSDVGDSLALMFRHFGTQQDVRCGFLYSSKNGNKWHV